MDFSIRDQLLANGSKAYLRNLAAHGYEMGVGHAGAYDSHAHRGFTDIAFAPGGLSIGDCGSRQHGLLHITPPGAWFGPITFHSEFWFVKFFQSQADRCLVPDKVTDPAEVAHSWCAVTSEFRGAFPSDLGRDFSFRIVDQRLVVGGLDGPDSEMVVAA